MKGNETKPALRKTEKTVVCRSCAASFSADLPQCPYCGTMNLPAAEQAYMNKLEGIRGDLSELHEQTKRDMKTGFRKLQKRLIVIGVLIALLLGGLAVHDLVRQKQENLRDKEEIVWQLDNIPRLDRLYENGDYDELAVLYEEFLCAGHKVYNYQHARFCECLWLVLHAEDQIGRFDAGELFPADLLYAELQLYQIDNGRLQMTDEERACLLERRAPVFEDMFRRFALSEEEAAAFRSQILNDGFLNLEELDAFVKGKGM